MNDGAVILLKSPEKLAIDFTNYPSAPHPPTLIQPPRWSAGTAAPSILSLIVADGPRAGPVP